MLNSRMSWMLKNKGERRRSAPNTKLDDDRDTKAAQEQRILELEAVVASLESEVRKKPGRVAFEDDDASRSVKEVVDACSLRLSRRLLSGERFETPGYERKKLKDLVNRFALRMEMEVVTLRRQGLIGQSVNPSSALLATPAAEGALQLSTQAIEDFVVSSAAGHADVVRPPGEGWQPGKATPAAAAERVTKKNSGSSGRMAQSTTKKTSAATAKAKSLTKGGGGGGGRATGSESEIAAKGRGAVEKNGVESEQSCGCGNVFKGDSCYCRACGAKRPWLQGAHSQRTWTTEGGGGSDTAPHDRCACGNKFKKDSAYCRRCGAPRPPLQTASNRRPSTAAQCACGYQFRSSGAREYFCRQCGLQRRPPERSVPSSSSSSSSSSMSSSSSFSSSSVLPVTWKRGRDATAEQCLCGHAHQGDNAKFCSKCGTKRPLRPGTMLFQPTLNQCG